MGLKVLVACEFSGIVREAFKARGHEAISCDFLPTEIPGAHYEGDVKDIINQGWDLMICHPPCTHLASSGARWFKEKQYEQAEALDFIRFLLSAPIPKICLENPVGIISSKIRKPDQVIQPHMFGVAETKATCFWLKNLASLRLDITKFVNHNIKDTLHRLPPSEDRWKIRSRTFPQIAAAMAENWG